MSALSCVAPCANILGEGPVWHPGEQALYWVDIKAGRLYRLADGQARHWDLPDPATALAARARGGLVLATRGGLMAFTPDDGLPPTRLCPIETDRPGNRPNDGKTDPMGRFWIGTMDDAERQVSGALYRIDADLSVTRVLDDIGIANTLAWSADGRRFHFADSMAQTIYAFDADPQTGTLTNRRPFVSLTGTDRGPDGSTMDAEGYLWNCQWDGWRVVRYAPDGQIDRIVELPVQRPTSCMFGGPDLDILYITTARVGLAGAALADQPWAGHLLALRPGVRGRAETPFAG